MEEWNAAVDSYIDEVLDMTPVFEIEMGAKIDSRGGPLYKCCEAEGCKSVEGRDVVKMKCCSGCKLVCNNGIYISSRFTADRISHRSSTAVGSVSRGTGKDTRKTAAPRRIAYNFCSLWRVFKPLSPR